MLKQNVNIVSVLVIIGKVYICKKRYIIHRDKPYKAMLRLKFV
jgi:hypothetical protein